MIQPKKSLGQNFLVDNNIAQDIVNSLGCDVGDFIMEIGPGTGALTGMLLDKKINLTAIELDKRAVQLLKEKYSSEKYSNFVIIENDILDFNLINYLLTNKINSKIKVIGNIPYNISSGIIFWLINNSDYIEKAVLTIQKDVALRLAGKPGTKDYGILTVALNMTGKAKILFDISPDSFYPVPKVWSSVIELNFNNIHFDKEQFLHVMDFVKASFNQRRKKLGNSLKSYLERKYNKKSSDVSDMITGNFGIDYFSKRAEELSVDEFIKLHEFFEAKLKK